MTKNKSELTGKDNYFEDFTVGDVYRHARGKTMTPVENVALTNMVMNTAAGHFDEWQMKRNPAGSVDTIVVYGGITFSLVLGLSSQDCVENALQELSLDNIRLSKMVTHGDSIYAYSEVLSKSDAGRQDAGIVTFRHYGVNQDDELVAQVERTALIKRREHWAK